MNLEEEEIISASAVPSERMGITQHSTGSRDSEGGEDDSKFSEAERRLREELAAFKLK